MVNILNCFLNFTLKDPVRYMYLGIFFYLRTSYIVKIKVRINVPSIIIVKFMKCVLVLERLVDFDIMKYCVVHAYFSTTFSSLAKVGNIFFFYTYELLVKIAWRY